MKKLLLLSALIFGVAPVAQAGILLPNLYAEEYCGLREMGADRQGALEAATRKAMIDGDPVKVTIDGETYDSDVVQSFRAIMDRCPQYLN